MYQTKSLFYQRLAGYLIALYPACWRERYAEEMLLILEEMPPTFKTILNLCLHIFDAYLHQTLIKERTTYMLQRIRFNELVIYSAVLAFFVAWYPSQFFITANNTPATMVLTRGFMFTPSPLVNIIHVVSYLLLLLFLLGGLPILLAACWQALKARNFPSLLFCLLGLASPLIAVVMSFIVIYVSRTALSLPIIIIGQCISVAFTIFSIQRVVPSQRITHYSLFLATLIPVVMLIGLVALLTQYQAGDFLHEYLRILVMLVALAFSIISLKNSMQAKRAVQYIPQEEVATV
jgi:hypothetical protein